MTTGALLKRFYERSIESPEAFWEEQAALIHWEHPFERVLDYSKPPFARWFPGGKTNLCHNAVDRHLAERGDSAIYVYFELGQHRCGRSLQGVAVLLVETANLIHQRGNLGLMLLRGQGDR